VWNSVLKRKDLEPMKKIIICLTGLFLLSVTTALLQSCCRESDKRCQWISSLSVIAMDNGGEEPVKVQNEVKAKAMMLDLSGEIDESTCYKPNISLMPAAYAFKCVNYAVEDSVVALNIYADKKYDADHEAGVPLNDIFKMKSGNILYYGSVQHYYLLSNPDDTGTFTFSVKVQMASGRIVSADTEPIKLVK
jgi:hypothetical protein